MMATCDELQSMKTVNVLLRKSTRSLLRMHATHTIASLSGSRQLRQPRANQVWKQSPLWPDTREPQSRTSATPSGVHDGEQRPETCPPRHRFRTRPSPRPRGPGPQRQRLLARSSDTRTLSANGESSTDRQIVCVKLRIFVLKISQEQVLC